jgi:putative radical SAM enzyme (TIGR03279 family)
MLWPAEIPSTRGNRSRPAAGGVVERVRPGSIAAALGMQPGDRIREVNDTPLRDYIDYRFLTSEPEITVRVTRPNGTEVLLEIEKDPDEDLGLEFTEDIFGGPDAVRSCGNSCVFCFVDRLPRGLRPALYVKDDDYRLSFLHGNFITLTNLTDPDVRRIESQRLNPLYVSVHVTQPELRATMMGNSLAAGILEQLRDLADRGVRVHGQIVVCPGWNDGPHLERTIADLADLRPAVESVGVVPVGLGHSGPAGSGSRGPVGALPIRPATPGEKAAMLDLTLTWHRRLGGFVYPADELFLSLDRPLPASSFYDDFPQLQNGIGLARVFLEDLARLERVARRQRNSSLPSEITRPKPGGATAAANSSSGASLAAPFTVITGRLARPLVDAAVALVSRLTGRPGQVVTAGSELFGPEVTVAGLLAGEDVVQAAKGLQGSGPVLVPRSALRAGSDELLDGQTLHGISREHGRPFLDGGFLPSHMLAALRP